MKTTLEIPAPIFRRAKSVAPARGIPLREFVIQAVRNTLMPKFPKSPGQSSLAALKHLHKETQRINRIIEEEFEKVEPQDLL